MAQRKQSQSGNNNEVNAKTAKSFELKTLIYARTGQVFEELFGSFYAKTVNGKLSDKNDLRELSII